MGNQGKLRRCPACRQAELQEATYARKFHPHGRVVTVELLVARCPSCGSQATSAAQHAENLRRLKSRKDQYDGLLLGEEILALRRRYGITQQAAAKLFGKGKIAFSRYENETSYPDESTTRLLQLAIERPDVVRWLAERSDVELPLWEARCESERKAKVRMVSIASNRWAQAAAAVAVHVPLSGDVLRRWAGNDLKHSTQHATANDDHYAMGQVAFA